MLILQVERMFFFCYKKVVGNFYTPDKKSTKKQEYKDRKCPFWDACNGQHPMTACFLGETGGC